MDIYVLFLILMACTEMSFLLLDYINLYTCLVVLCFHFYN